MSIEYYDDIVLGGGKAGKTLAPALVAAGRRTALIEREPTMVGGSCINVACIPTKTLLASAEVATSARGAGAYGVTTGAVTVDAVAAQGRKTAVVEALRAKNLETLDRALGANLVFGHARFLGPSTLEVVGPDGVRTFEAQRIFVNTGARPDVPEVPGLSSLGFFTSETLLDLNEVPDHLLIVGGGFIALEFAHLYRSWGSEVTVVVRGRLLPQVDTEVAARVLQSLRDEGITVHLGARVAAASAGPTLVLEGPDAPSSVTGTHLLIATGRRPNTDALDLAAAGVAVDPRGFIVVNERLETLVPGVWALGDVTGGPQFTHLSLDDFRVVHSNLVLGVPRTTRGRLVPSCLFIEPELAQVGLTEDQAQSQGLVYRVARLEAVQVPRARTLGKTKGLLKALVGPDDRILGCTLFCHAAGEMISTVQLAMTGGLPYTVLRDGLLAHPTMTEGLNLLFGALTKISSSSS